MVHKLRTYTTILMFLYRTFVGDTDENGLAPKTRYTTLLGT